MTNLKNPLPAADRQRLGTPLNKRTAQCYLSSYFPHMDLNREPFASHPSPLQIELPLPQVLKVNSLFHQIRDLIIMLDYLFF